MDKRGLHSLAPRYLILRRLAEPPAARAGVDEAVVFQVIVLIGKQDREDDTTVEFFEIGTRIG